MTEQDDLRGIATELGAMLSTTQSYRHADILGTGRPLALRRQSVGDVDADEAIARRPERNIVVIGRAGGVFVAAGEAAAMNEDQTGRVPVAPWAVKTSRMLRSAGPYLMSRVTVTPG